MNATVDTITSEIFLNDMSVPQNPVRLVDERRLAPGLGQPIKRSMNECDLW